MGFLLDSLDETKFRAQLDIVKNERRQTYDNRPYARDNEVLAAFMYPSGHPYSRLPIGSMDDLTKASVDDIKQFFRTYYVPNNAALVIVGDFDPKQAKAWVAKYFGDLPRGKAIARPSVGPSALTGEKRITFFDRVQVPRLVIEWPSVGSKNPDHPALDILSDILGNFRVSRITNALVYDKQSAASVNVFQNAVEDAGQFQVIVTPRPGHTLTELEAQVDSIITQFKHDGPTADELKRVKAIDALGLMTALESNLGKAIRFGEDQTIFGNPAYSFEQLYPRQQAVSASDVERVANKYLGSARVVLSTVPVGKPELASHPGQSALVSDPFAETAAPRKP
jgi:zinc protease